MRFLAFRSARGFSIVEVLVAVSIMSIVGVGFANLIVNTTRDQRAIQEKFALLEVQNSILSAFANSATCIAELTNGSAVHLNLEASSIATTTLTLNEIRSGSGASAALLARVGESLPGFTGNQLKVSGITFGEFLATGNPDEYTGIIQVAIDPTTLIRPMRAIRVRQLFSARPDPSLSTALLNSCESPTATMGEWESRPSGTVILADKDGFLAITSAFNRGFIVQSKKSVGGSCLGVALTNRLQISARDKYGQGVVGTTIPIKAGECYRVATVNVSGSITGEIAQLNFRSMN